MAKRALRLLRMSCLALGAVAGVACGEDLAVLSLVGKRLTIVVEGQQVGTHLDGNVYTSVPLVDATLDDLVVGVAEAAIKSARPDASVTRLRAHDRAARTIGEGWMPANSAELQAIVSLVALELRPAPGTRLLLVLPYRTEPELASYSGYRGTGSAAGLGFYVGWGPVNRSLISGFLGVFANLQLVLVDMGTGGIVAQERAVVGEVHSAATSTAPWDALSAEAKIAALTTLLRREIERGVRAMLGSAG